MSRGRIVSSCFAALFVTAALTPAARALPPRAPAETGEDGESKVILEVSSRAITGDSRTYCKVRLVAPKMDANGRALAAGDTIDLAVYESDGGVGFDDLIWELPQYTVVAGDLTGATFDKTYDCTGDFSSDGFGASLEVYAEAYIDRASCGWTCLNEFDPETDSVAVAEAGDDSAESDDTSAQARALGNNDTAPERVVADQDWVKVTLGAAGRLTARIVARQEEGQVDVTLRGAGPTFTKLDEGVDNNEGVTVDKGGLAAGVYYVVIEPRQSNDFNYYDLFMTVDASCECTPDAMEMEPCGRCGTRSRTCGSSCEWGAFTACTGEAGECDPAQTEDMACGMCGKKTRTCSDTCMWGAFGTCGGERGMCEAGAKEMRSCSGGEQTRTCQADCSWGAYGPCQTGGGGGCTPTGDEVCRDGIDNDCDGMTDEGSDCMMAEARIGDPCQRNADCGTGRKCLGPPGLPAFESGYCADDGCTASSCDAGAQCVTGPAGEKYCFDACTADSDCRDGYTCVAADNSKKVCMPKCQTDEDCFTPGKPKCAASSGKCEAGSGGATDGGTGGGAPCTTNTDCALGNICDGTSKACTPGCQTNPDCPDGQSCQGGMCMTGSSTGGTTDGGVDPVGGGSGGGGGGGGCASGGTPTAFGLLAGLAALALVVRRRRPGR